MERRMSKRIARLAWACAPAGLLLIASATADVYTWVDAKGNVNVSNLKPPAGARVTNIAREDPEAAARADAARTAARDAEMRKLSDRVAELERANDAPPPAYAAPPLPPPQVTQLVVTVMPPEPPMSAPPDYAPYASCGAFDCLAPWGVGYYGVPVVAFGSNFGRNRHRMRPQPKTTQAQAVIPFTGAVVPMSNPAARTPRRG
jgi:hypothetical protein